MNESPSSCTIISWVGISTFARSPSKYNLSTGWANEPGPARVDRSKDYSVFFFKAAYHPRGLPWIFVYVCCTLGISRTRPSAYHYYLIIRYVGMLSIFVQLNYIPWSSLSSIAVSQLVYQPLARFGFTSLRSTVVQFVYCTILYCARGSPAKI